VTIPLNEISLLVGFQCFSTRIW